MRKQAALRTSPLNRPGLEGARHRLPFASPNALFGLSRLSIQWLRLGIRLERIRPGHPQQNGGHERMYLTLKQQVATPANFNPLRRAHFEAFQEVYNPSGHRKVNLGTVFAGAVWEYAKSMTRYGLPGGRPPAC